MADLFANRDNPATQTLQCKGPFEVLRLTPGVFQPDEIKRQYRRLALLLHPDKNRHSDAEAAFKKLTAAFETLHDPTKQAASRATAEYGQNKRRKGDRHKSSTAGNTGTRAAHNSGSQDRTGSEEGRGEKGNGPFGGGGAGSRGSGGGMGAGEAPRWCREGEYVPRKEREKDGEEDVPEDGKGAKRSAQDLWEDFEQQEKIFKEEAAQAKERNVEKKRAKAEARAAADQERMERLRADVLGDGADTAIESKTASWQQFTSSRASAKPRKHKKEGVGIATAAAASRPAEHRSRARPDQRETFRDGFTSPLAEASRSEVGRDSGNIGGGGGTKGTPLGAAVDTHPGRAKGEAAVETKPTATSFVCWVCRRGFKSQKGLTQHQAKSELHLINVQLRDFLSP